MNAKILVIDDSEIVRECLTDVLEEAGYDVVAKSTSCAGFIALNREKPDLVLLDLHMPGLNGESFLAATKGPRNHRCPVVLYSSLGPEELGPTARRLGADGFIHKQHDNEQLVGSVRWWLSRHQAKPLAVNA